MTESLTFEKGCFGEECYWEIGLNSIQGYCDRTVCRHAVKLPSDSPECKYTQAYRLPQVITAFNTNNDATAVCLDCILEAVKEMKMETKSESCVINGTEHTPRHNLVLIRLQRKHITRKGVAIPENAPESLEWFVEAFGPEVIGLNKGDQVLVMGEVGQDIAAMMGVKDYYLTRETNIMCVVKAVE
jgi:hypothetical protein